VAPRRNCSTRLAGGGTAPALPDHGQPPGDTPPRRAVPSAAGPCDATEMHHQKVAQAIRPQIRQDRATSLKIVVAPMNTGCFTDIITLSGESTAAASANLPTPTSSVPRWGSGRAQLPVLRLSAIRGGCIYPPPDHGPAISDVHYFWGTSGCVVSVVCGGDVVPSIA
jgi:hypothetical protein